MPSFQPRTGPYISKQVVSRDSHQHPVLSVYINHHVCSQDHFDQQQNLTLKLAPFIHHGQLQLHFLQFWIKQPWSQHAQPWDSPFQLNQEHILHLHWFCNPEVLQGVPLLSDGLGSQLARTTNYGTVVAARATTTHKLSGTGSRPLGHLSLGPQWFQQTVCVYCDKSTAVAYIRKQRGMHSLSLFHKTLELFQLLDKFAIILVHLQGARSNVTADALSRLDSPSPTEWRLPLGTLNSLFFAFRTPLMDMFATVENKVTPIYVSPYPTTVLGQ